MKINRPYLAIGVRWQAKTYYVPWLIGDAFEEQSPTEVFIGWANEIRLWSSPEPFYKVEFYADQYENGCAEFSDYEIRKLKEYNHQGINKSYDAITQWFLGLNPSEIFGLWNEGFWRAPYSMKWLLGEELKWVVTLDLDDGTLYFAECLETNESEHESEWPLKVRNVLDSLGPARMCKFHFSYELPTSNMESYAKKHRAIEQFNRVTSVWSLFMCDIYKSPESMRFIGTATNSEEKAKAILELVRSNIVDWYDEPYTYDELLGASDSDINEWINHLYIVENDGVITDSGFYYYE